MLFRSVAQLSTANTTVVSTEADAVAPTFTAHETPAPSFAAETRSTPAPAIAATPDPVQSEADVVVMPAIEVAAPVAVIAPTTTTASIAPAAPAELPKVEFQALEATALTPVLESAGLVWVNTDSQKLAEVRAQIAAEPVTTHAPRQPKPPVLQSTGPMVLVETGGKEQTIEK